MEMGKAFLFVMVRSLPGPGSNNALSRYLEEDFQRGVDRLHLPWYITRESYTDRRVVLLEITCHTHQILLMMESIELEPSKNSEKHEGF